MNTLELRLLNNQKNIYMINENLINFPPLNLGENKNTGNGNTSRNTNNPVNSEKVNSIPRINNFKPMNNPNNGNSNGSNRQNSGNNSPRRNNRRPVNTDPKTQSVTAQRPQYMARREENSQTQNLDFLNGKSKSYSSSKQSRGTGMLTKGNLGHATVSASFNTGPLIQTNSIPVFPEGNIVRLIPLGGVNEVGMNMTAIECGDDIVLVDSGLGFGGGERFPGVDYIIPDTGYIEQNRHKIRGIIYTHGHLDHIGAAPYILPKLGPIPIFSMPLTLALLKNRLQEFDLADKIVAKIINLEQPLTLGVFKFQFFRLNHSIPDVVGLCIDTPMGRIIYATDWKFDNTPIDGQLSDYGKLAKFGDEGVRLLLTDSLGVMKPGYQISEKEIGKTISKIFAECEGRIIFTTFASSISRAQLVIDACVKNNRKLALVGRSMITNFKACFELGYLKVPQGMIVEMKDIAKLPDNQVCVLATGSQGEELAGLSRMSRDEHDQIRLQGGDAVIFSSTTIPGNEDSIQHLIAQLSRKGVTVYSPKEFQLHVSGHACQEDLKLLFALTRPDYLQPIHGNHFMLKKVGELGAGVGIPADHCLIGENGRIIELRSKEVALTEDVITESYLLVDGTGVGAVSEVVLEERRQMSTQGSVIVVLLVNKQKNLVGGPELISRGFVYMKTSVDLFDLIRDEIRAKFPGIKVDPESKTYWTEMRQQVRNIAKDFISAKTEKEPMIIPVIVQV
jgi:ribonuclease J